MPKENQHELNQRVEKLIREKDKNAKSYSIEDMELINQYEGSGGQGSNGAKGEGILYEFYTPDFVCELMWRDNSRTTGHRILNLTLLSYRSSDVSNDSCYLPEEEIKRSKNDNRVFGLKTKAKALQIKQKLLNAA